MTLIRLDVASRPLDGGRSFGDAGAYEELSGEATFAVDPRLPLNSVITDLDLAPRDATGRVQFAADVRILRPTDPARGNRGIFLDVVNRGSSIFVRMTEPGPLGPDTQLSDGWLLRRGYTIVSCGWQHDVPRGSQRLFGLSAPHALLNGSPITGPVTTTKQLDAPSDVLEVFEAVSSDSAYAVADLADQHATLSVRDDPHGQAEVVPRQRWRFVDRYHISCDDGFLPGRIYEITYTTVGAPLTGIGFLAIRDVASHLRFDAGGYDFSLAMGASQTARFLRQLVYLGCCEDEQHRLAIDGVLAIAGGARMTEANWRFGQPSAQGAMSAAFPYTDAVETDSATGRADGLLRRALARGRLPKIIYLNTSSEYCSGAAIVHLSAALTHLAADGTADTEPPDNVRMYHCAGTQHAPAALPLSRGQRPTIYFPNTIDYKPFIRAAIDNLSAWVRVGTPPPPNAHPTLADGTLVQQGLRPATDEDGNETGGLRHPEVSVPLATYTGWNPRHPDSGAAHLLARATGATIPFARTTDERRLLGDTRLSIGERYASRDAYLAQVRYATQALVGGRYLLGDEVEPMLEATGQRWDEFTALPELGPLPGLAAVRTMAGTL